MAEAVRELGPRWTNTLALEIEETLDEVIDEIIELQLVDGVDETGAEIVQPAFTEPLTLEDLLAMDDREAIEQLQILLMDPHDQAEGVSMFADWLEAKTGMRGVAGASQFGGS